MNPLYVQLASVAKSLLVQFGFANDMTVLEQRADGATGKVVNVAVQTGSFQMVQLPPTSGQADTSFEEKWKEDLISGKARKLLIAGQGAPFVPSVGNLIQLDGAAWILQAIKTINPDTQLDIIYTTIITRTSLDPLTLLWQEGLQPAVDNYNTLINTTIPVTYPR